MLLKGFPTPECLVWILDLVLGGCHADDQSYYNLTEKMGRRRRLWRRLLVIELS